MSKIFDLILKDELIGKNISSFIHPNEYAKFTNVFTNNTGINHANQLANSSKQLNANKIKPFPCQMLIKNNNDKNSSNQAIDVDKSRK